MKAQTLSLLCSVILIGCAAKKGASEDSINELHASVESGVTTISGLADDQSGGSFAQAKTMMVTEAGAGSCSRAVADPCNNGVKIETYAGCGLPFSPIKLDGQVTLTYSNAACTMTSVGDSVERSYEVNLNGLYGGVLNISSASHVDYRGNTLGGGGRLTKTAGGWQEEVLGKHKSFTRKGKELFDISTRTITPLNVTGTLNRAGRVVSGGSYEVIHNKAKFTATYTPVNLAWSNACCHPVSGTLTVSYDGSIHGSATVTFNGCGLATFAKDGLSEEITLNYCE